MMAGTLLVIGGDGDWIRTLAGALSGADLRVLTDGDDPEWLLSRGADAPHDWELRRPGGPSSVSAPEAAVTVGGRELPPGEIAGRVLACVERERLLDRQRAIMAGLDNARRDVDADHEELRQELARAGRLLAEANAALEERVAELSRVNGQLRLVQELNGRILEALPEALIACDDSGRITLWSGGASGLLGWDSREATGRPLAQLLRSPDAEGHLMAKILQHAPDRDRVRLTLLSRRREPRPVEIRVLGMRSETDGEAPGPRLLLLTDLAKKELTEEIQRRRDRLASLGELSAGVAHEIRNPLAGIGTCAELLRSRLTPGASEQEFVGVILEEVQRLEKIVSDLTTFARPGEAQPRLDDLHRLLDRMLLLLGGQIRRREIAVTRRYDRRLPKIRIDPDQTLQLLLNVGLNAVQAMPEGGALTLTTMEVTLPSGEKEEGEPGRFLRLRIQDTGPGIPLELRDKVFNPFFTTKSKGSGLGLSIGQRIVEEQGGTMYVEASSGPGAIVVIDFPLDPAPSPGEDQAELFPGGTE